MKYLMLCICLALTSAVEKENAASSLKETKGLDDQINFKLEVTKGLENTLNDVLPHPHKLQQFEPLTIRSGIPPELLIPSISAENAAGLNYQIPINSNLNVESYSENTLSGLSFGNGFSSADLNTDLPNLSIGSGLITIPVQQIGSVSDYNIVLNLDTSSVAGLAPLELKQIENPNPIIDYPTKLLNSKAYSIEQATSVTKLDFSERKKIKSDTKNPVLINDYNYLSILREIKKPASKLPTKVSYSIEKVPEVASIHKTGPFVSSDIPSIPELLKIFDSKSINDVPHTPEKTITVGGAETTASKLEPSDDDILKLIEERIGPSHNKTNSTNLRFGNDTANFRLDNSDADTLTEITTEQADITTIVNEVSQSTINKTKSLQVENDLDNASNETKNNKLRNATDSIKVPLSHNIDIKKLCRPKSHSDFNKNISADNSQPNKSNEILVQPLLGVTKLNASNFVNASDILKETPEFQAIVESSDSLNSGASAEPLSIDDIKGLKSRFTGDIDLKDIAEGVNVTDILKEDDFTTTEINLETVTSTDALTETSETEANTVKN